MIKILTAAFALAFGMGGCIDEKTTDENHLPMGTPWPEFTVSGPSGTVTEADFDGRRTLIVLFRTTCGDCKRELPGVQKAWERFGGEDGFRLAAISKEDASVVAKYWEDNEYTMPYYIDANGAAFTAFDVNYVPTLYLFCSSGIVAYVAVEKAEQFKNLIEHIEELP